MKKFAVKFELKAAVNWLEDAIITISGPALVMVFIFLSGWFREDEHGALETSAHPTINPDVLNVLVERLDHLSVTVNQLTNPSMPALPAPTREAENSLENDQPIYPAQFASKKQEIAAILAQRPGASAQEIAQEASCSVRTAEKWMQKHVAESEE